MTGARAVGSERGRQRRGPDEAMCSASSRAISGPSVKPVVAISAWYPGSARRLADDRREVVGERHHARPGADDLDVGEAGIDAHGHGRVAGGALPQRRVARRRRLGPRRPAAADDERVVGRLLQRETTADVLHHRLEHPRARLGHVQVQALGANREAQAAERGDVVRPGARGVDDPMGARSARGSVVHREAVRAAVRARLDRASPPRASASSAPRSSCAQREQRRGEQRVRVAFVRGTRPRPARSSAR